MQHRWKLLSGHGIDSLEPLIFKEDFFPSFALDDERSGICSRFWHMHRIEASYLARVRICAVATLFTGCGTGSRLIQASWARSHVRSVNEYRYNHRPPAENGKRTIPPPPGPSNSSGSLCCYPYPYLHSNMDSPTRTLIIAGFS